MDNTPSISVIMSVYGELPEHLCLAVDSILKQTFRDFEFIIIADAPKNDTLLRILEEIVAMDSRIILLKNESNLGLAASLNHGIAIARGRYIARMDADDISDPSRLQIQYDHMEANKKVDFLFSWVDYIEQNGNYVRTFSPERKKATNIKRYFFSEHLLVHPTLFCKNKVLKELLYDASFVRSQDFELWMRAIYRYSFDIVPKVLLQYRILDDDDTVRRIQKLRSSVRGALKAIRKNYSIHYGNLCLYPFILKILILGLVGQFPVTLIKIIHQLNFLKGKHRSGK